MIHRVRGWSAQWGPIFPLLVAELTIWIGFGALLPILPIYFTEHGVDIKTLGVVVAAWPAARLVGEPLSPLDFSTTHELSVTLHQDQNLQLERHNLSLTFLQEFLWESNYFYIL